MKISLLNRRVEILTVGRAPDDGGGFVLAFTHKHYAWAEIRQLASARDLSADRAARLKRLSAAVRFTRDIRVGERLRLDGADYEIASIESDGARDRRLVLICEEVAA
jgi:SPP1 family predicted phage head-tail adaptor